MEVNLSDNLKNMGGLSKEIITRGLNLTSQDLIRNLMINSPVDHGLLKQWAVTSQSDVEITIQSPAEYAAAQNYGTDPYVILPKNKKALFWPGADHPVKMVKHPGLKGKHFVEDSIEATSARIQEFFTING